MNKKEILEILEKNMNKRIEIIRTHLKAIEFEDGKKPLISEIRKELNHIKWILGETKKELLK